ncbi:hypothetical protein BOX15_Mlig001396g1 [Macrostomum lignano]|uniref:Death domain-containing protein n=1 Tax=Macrostomum lignano TaxID=282301 RepID=A0A267G5V7_9PLAT|nr:hypothetical protein BOX15_Mlig001396g1 [Macrostomum lignano]
MGNQIALITKSGSIQVGERSNPSRADWITEHAVATGLSVVEVERLWLRFQQLGCTSEGLITNDVLRKRSIYSEDTFLRKFIGYLRDDFRSDGKVTFQNFCNAMYWIEKATARDKLNAIFNYLNNGNPLDKDTVRQILPKIIENDSEQGYDRLADILMEQLAGSGTEGGGVNAAESYISQDSFVQYCLDSIPKSRLEALLAFNVIPRHVSDQARQELERAEADGGRRQPTQAAAAPEAQVDAAEAVYTVPTDAQLAVVAQRASRRDYRLLGNKLGFYESDMNQIENLYRGDRFQQLYHMLIEWRKREGKAAYVITLQKVLQECLMPDIAAELNPKHRDEQKTWKL